MAEFNVRVYHVVDKEGKHRFISINDLAYDMTGFEKQLARQYKSFESLGQTRVKMIDIDRFEVDADGSRELSARMAGVERQYPQQCQRVLEPWMPD